MPGRDSHRTGGGRRSGWRRQRARRSGGRRHAQPRGPVARSRRTGPSSDCGLYPATSGRPVHIGGAPSAEPQGFAHPVAAFEVLGERALASRFAARQGAALTPIVGRDQELAQLVERWRQAIEGEGQAILVTGEAGIGKSRIAEALVAAAESGPHILLRYQCSPYHGDSALYPAIQQITQAARFTPDDTTEHHLDRLEALLALGVEATAQLIAGLIGLTDRRVTVSRRCPRSSVAAAPLQPW